MVLDNPKTLIIMKRKLMIRRNRLPANHLLRPLYSALINPLNVILVSIYKQNFADYVKNHKTSLWQEYRKNIEDVNNEIAKNLASKNNELAPSSKMLIEINTNRIKNNNDHKFNIFDLIHLRHFYENFRLEKIHAATINYKKILALIPTQFSENYEKDFRLIDQLNRFINKLHHNTKIKLIESGTLITGNNQPTKKLDKFYYYPFSMHASYINSENPKAINIDNSFLMLAALFAKKIIPLRQAFDPLHKSATGKTCHGKIYQWAWAVANNSQIAIENISTKQTALAQNKDAENHNYDKKAGRELDFFNIDLKTTGKQYIENIKQGISSLLQQLSAEKTYLFNMLYTANNTILEDKRSVLQKLFSRTKIQIEEQYSAHAFGIRCAGIDGQEIEFYDANDGIMQFKSYAAFINFFLCYQLAYAVHLKKLALMELPSRNNLNFKYSSEFDEFQQLSDKAKKLVVTQLKQARFNNKWFERNIVDVHEFLECVAEHENKQRNSSGNKNINFQTQKTNSHLKKTINDKIRSYNFLLNKMKVENLKNKEAKNISHKLLDNQLDKDIVKSLHNDKFQKPGWFKSLLVWLFIDLRILIIPILFDIFRYIAKLIDNYVLKNRAKEYNKTRKTLINNYSSVINENGMQKIFQNSNKTLLRMFGQAIENNKYAQTLTTDINNKVSQRHPLDTCNNEVIEKTPNPKKIYTT